ncbi:hypothetical protein [Neobacillus jeddahensis]|nr:hypothetical protein [Neobacillus jeddahensis]
MLIISPRLLNDACIILSRKVETNQPNKTIQCKMTASTYLFTLKTVSI